MTAAYVRNVGRNCSMSKNPVVIGAENHCEKKTRMWNTVGTAPGGNVTSIQGRSLYLHRSPASDAIYRFKFKNQRVYAKVFAEEMAGRFCKRSETLAGRGIDPHSAFGKETERDEGIIRRRFLARELSEANGHPGGRGRIISDSGYQTAKGTWMTENDSRI